MLAAQERARQQDSRNARTDSPEARPPARDPGRCERFVEFVEALGNFFFYLFAFLIIVLPPLRWLTGLFSGNHPLVVAAAAVVFAILLPALAPLAAEHSFTLLEKIKSGELFKTFFRPFRAVCAVVSLYGILALEYKVLHSQTESTLLEVFWELMKAL